MFSFFKKKYSIDSALLSGLTDIHSHILFGVDDGAGDLTDSISILKTLSEYGVKHAFCTPHVMAGMHANSKQNLETILETLRRECNSIGIELRLGAEYMLDDQFLSLLKRGNILSYDGKHLLVEMSYYAPPHNLSEMIFQIKLSGYVPVIAHPERYAGFMTLTNLSKMREEGCKLQMNLLSLGETYGRHTQKLCHNLLEADLYDFIGTDIHNAKIKGRIDKIKIDRKKHNAISRLVENNKSLWI